MSVTMESRIPQLSVAYSTSDENTPGNTIQLEELVHVNATIILPEVS